MHKYDQVDPQELLDMLKALTKNGEDTQDGGSEQPTTHLIAK